MQKALTFSLAVGKSITVVIVNLLFLGGAGGDSDEHVLLFSFFLIAFVEIQDQALGEFGSKNAKMLASYV